MSASLGVTPKMEVSKGPQNVSLFKVIFYIFYNGKSPCCTTIWGFFGFLPTTKQANRRNISSNIRKNHRHKADSTEIWKVVHPAKAKVAWSKMYPCFILFGVKHGEYIN